MPTGTPVESFATVEAVAGEVWIRADENGARQLLAIGESAPVGAEIETSPDGLVALRLEIGHSVRVGGGSRVLSMGDGSRVRGPTCLGP